MKNFLIILTLCLNVLFAESLPSTSLSFSSNDTSKDKKVLIVKNDIEASSVLLKEALKNKDYTQIFKLGIFFYSGEYKDKELEKKYKTYGYKLIQKVFTDNKNIGAGYYLLIDSLSKDRKIAYTYVNELLAIPDLYKQYSLYKSSLLIKASLVLEFDIENKQILKDMIRKLENEELDDPQVSFLLSFLYANVGMVELSTSYLTQACNDKRANDKILSFCYSQNTTRK